ncbi:Flagellar L-ring protein 2 [Bienertia sinuspersici]
MAEVEDLNEVLGQQHQQEDENEDKEEINGGVKEELKPWEQHSAVISIPRFDYNAPSSLLRHSHTGFLITCPIKREKSATKEAISILGKPKLIGVILQYIESRGSDCLGVSDTCENVKRRKLDQLWGDSAITIKSELSKDESHSVKQTPNLVLVKVTRSGLLLFTFPKGHSFDPVSIVCDVNRSLESGASKRPLWCHRIFPIQATCMLNEKEVSTTVSILVRKYVDDKSNNSSRPLKFAVGYNRRGIEETEMKNVKDNNNNSVLDRNKCFSPLSLLL